MNDTLNDTLNDANDTLNKPLKPGITSDYGNHKEQIILLVREDPAIIQEQLAQALKVAEELTGRDEREP